MKLILASILFFSLIKIAVAAKTDDGILAIQKKDYATALKIFTEEAKKNDARAQMFLASMYIEGLAIKKDTSEALRLMT